MEIVQAADPALPSLPKEVWNIVLDKRFGRKGVIDGLNRTAIGAVCKGFDEWSKRHKRNSFPFFLNGKDRKYYVKQLNLFKKSKHTYKTIRIRSHIGYGEYSGMNRFKTILRNLEKKLPTNILLEDTTFMHDEKQAAPFVAFLEKNKGVTFLKFTWDCVFAQKIVQVQTGLTKIELYCLSFHTQDDVNALFNSLTENNTIEHVSMKHIAANDTFNVSGWQGASLMVKNKKNLKTFTLVACRFGDNLKQVAEFCTVLEGNTTLEEFTIKRSSNYASYSYQHLIIQALAKQKSIHKLSVTIDFSGDDIDASFATFIEQNHTVETLEVGFMPRISSNKKLLAAFATNKTIKKLFTYNRHWDETIEEIQLFYDILKVNSSIEYFKLGKYGYESRFVLKLVKLSEYFSRSLVLHVCGSELDDETRKEIERIVFKSNGRLTVRL